MPKSKHLRDTNKHNQYVNQLYNTLIKKPFIKEINKNVEYGTLERLIGECDVLVEFNNGTLAYYEIKTRHTEKGYFKAVKQLKRWTKRAYNGTYDCLGIYWTPEVWKTIYKNGWRI